MTGTQQSPDPASDATPSRLRVERIAGPDAAAERVLAVLQSTVERHPRGLISFATGGTFAGFYPRLAAAIQAGALSLDRLLCTHLDEYLGYTPDRPGGMVHELISACPPLGELLRQGSFLPVPGDGTPTAIQAHQDRIQRSGGVRLQMLGIGRNGHLAFNEPGAPMQGRFRRVQLSETTRRDAVSRFQELEPEGPGVPTEAVSAGLGDIMGAGRLVLVALGAAKADAVQAMLEGPIDASCPASVVRRHPDALVLVDDAAAARLASAP